MAYLVIAAEAGDNDLVSDDVTLEFLREGVEHGDIWGDISG